MVVWKNHLDIIYLSSKDEWRNVIFFPRGIQIISSYQKSIYINCLYKWKSGENYKYETTFNKFIWHGW